MTAPCPPLSHLAGIIAGWERAEGITVLHAWLSDSGDWRAEWREGSGRLTDTHRGGENHLKVSRLLADIKEALKGRDDAITHIARPGPTSLRAWTAEGQYLRWDAAAGVPESAQAEEVAA